jgi:hypothetical protein
MFDTVHYDVFWKLELQNETILEIRPVADMCFFLGKEKKWCAVSLLKSKSTGGIKSTTVTNYERREMDENDICIVDTFKAENGRFHILKIDSQPDGTFDAINVGDNFNNVDEDRCVKLLSKEDMVDFNFQLDIRNIVYRNNKLFWVVANPKKAYLRIKDINNWKDPFKEKKIKVHF